jgi:hypothetical protein
MLVRCDDCGGDQPNTTWRCRGCETTLPHNRRLLHALLPVVAIFGLGVLYLTIGPLIR